MGPAHFPSVAHIVHQQGALLHPVAQLLVRVRITLAAGCAVLHISVKVDLVDVQAWGLRFHAHGQSVAVEHVDLSFEASTALVIGTKEDRIAPIHCTSVPTCRATAAPCVGKGQLVVVQQFVHRRLGLVHAAHRQTAHAHVDQVVLLLPLIVVQDHEIVVRGVRFVQRPRIIALKGGDPVLIAWGQREVVVRSIPEEQQVPGH